MVIMKQTVTGGTCHDTQLLKLARQVRSRKVHTTGQHPMLELPNNQSIRNQNAARANLWLGWNTGVIQCRVLTNCIM